MEWMIYLDNAATTFPKPERVYKALDEANRNLAVNVGRGSYKVAREAMKLIDETKKKIIGLVHAPRGANVIFTASVTIALNEILNGLTLPAGANIYVSPFEHNAVARTVHLLKKKKQIKIIELPINPETLEIDIDRMKYQFSKERPVCVCCSHVSNVTGYVLPISSIFKNAKQYGAITVLDAAQSMGLLDFDAELIGADFIAFAGHKTLYGPFGIGGFIDVKGIPLDDYVVGGTGSDSLNLDMPADSPYKYESASPNIVAIAGLNAALEELDVEGIFTKEKELTEYLISGLNQIEGVRLYLPPKDKRIGIVSFNLSGYKADDVGMILDEDYNIAVRTGYHCAPFIHKYLKDEKSLGTVRVGLGRYSTKMDLDTLISSLKNIIA